MQRLSRQERFTICARWKVMLYPLCHSVGDFHLVGGRWAKSDVVTMPPSQSADTKTSSCLCLRVDWPGQDIHLRWCVHPSPVWSPWWIPWRNNQHATWHVVWSPERQKNQRWCTPCCPLYGAICGITVAHQTFVITSHHIVCDLINNKCCLISCVATKISESTLIYVCSYVVLPMHFVMSWYCPVQFFYDSVQLSITILNIIMHSKSCWLCTCSCSMIFSDIVPDMHDFILVVDKYLLTTNVSKASSSP